MIDDPRASRSRFGSSLAAWDHPVPDQKGEKMRLDCGRALLEMILPKHQELSFDEVCQKVEKASSKVKLEMDADSEGPQSKGRYLVASCALKAGDVILSEMPLFEGNTAAKKSEKVPWSLMEIEYFLTSKLIVRNNSHDPA